MDGNRPSPGQNEGMTRRHRVEIVLVVGVVALLAFLIRWEYKPAFYEQHVVSFEAEYGVEVGEPGPWFSAWALGDGQAYALIAIDSSGGELAEGINEAGYRWARAGYGWVTWAFSLGQSRLVPYALAIVGALSLAGVVAVAVMVRPKLGYRAWLMVLNPALFIGFAGDTSEPMAILLLAIALAWTSVVSAVLLGVTRPTFLAAAWGKWRLFLPGVASAAVLGLYGLLSFGGDAMLPSGGRLGLPLVAYAEHPSVMGLVLAVTALTTLVIGVRLRDWTWVLAGLFVLCFGSDVLRDPINAWRAAGFLPVMWAFGSGYRPVSTLDPDAEVSASAGL